MSRKTIAGERIRLAAARRGGEEKRFKHKDGFWLKASGRAALNLNFRRSLRGTIRKNARLIFNVLFSLIRTKRTRLTIRRDGSDSRQRRWHHGVLCVQNSSCLRLLFNYYFFHDKSTLSILCCFDSWCANSVTKYCRKSCRPVWEFPKW